MKYCKNCTQNVQPTKKFSFMWFIINCLWIVGGGVYIIYFIMKKKTCPMCGDTNFEHKHSKEQIAEEGGMIANGIPVVKQTLLERQQAHGEVLKQKNIRAKAGLKRQAEDLAKTKEEWEVQKEIVRNNMAIQRKKNAERKRRKEQAKLNKNM